MTDAYRFSAGEIPLLISVPHDGRELPADMAARMTAVGRGLPDTDWHVARLYEFASSLGASMIVANYSRYVVDLNRSADDANLYPGQIATGLCPTQTFAGDEIYTHGAVSDDEKRQRIDRYWAPYHKQIRDCLDTMRDEFGYALLWDAHSIGSEVPRLFDGELPVLNLGSNDSTSCSRAIETAVSDVLAANSYSHVVNGRFKGGHITRSYGDPDRHVHALQLEIAQRSYMDELTLQFDEDKAARLRDTLRQMLNAYLESAIQ